MKRILKILGVALLAIVLLTTCFGDNQKTSSVVTSGNPSGDTWSVFIYLCGTDLETQWGLASHNIMEMLQVSIPENVKVVIQTGGTEKWALEAINPEKIQRYEARGGNFEIAGEAPLANMGEADTLGSFLQWGVDKYPADKYMCLIWNHGGGSVTGVAFDELFEKDSLDIMELAEGIAAPGVQFEIIGFDACLMSTLETAAALAPYGRYMVASQEIEPGTGWDYTAWLKYLSENPEKDGLAVGKVICDSYFEKCKRYESDALATLSVIDLAEITNLVIAFDEMAAQIKGITEKPQDLQTFAQAMIKAENYGGNNKSEGYTNMVDLGDLVHYSKGVLPETSEQVLDTLQTAVKYKIAGKSRTKSNGLSVFVPLGVQDSDLDSYAWVAVSGHYLRFFEAIFDWNMPKGLQISPPVVKTSANQTTTISAEVINLDNVPAVKKLNHDDYKLEFSTYLTEDGSYVLEIEEGADIIQSVVYNLYYLEEETNSIIYLGSDFDLNYDEENKIYWDNFRNVWPVINDNICSMTALDWNDDYIVYTVPIRLNGQETNLRMSYYYDSASYEIHGAWDGIDEESGMSSKEVRKLKDGDTVEFLFLAADLESEEVYTFEFGGFTVKGSIVVEEATLFDAIYYYEYEIIDIFGRTYTSDFAIMVSVDGEITIETEN